MSHGLIARNFEWVLCELEARGHRIHVALDHVDKPGLTGTTSVLERIARDRPGLTFGPAPPRDPSSISAAARGFRLVLDYVRYLDPGYADAEKPRARVSGAIPRTLRLLVARPLRSARGRAVIRALMKLADDGVPAGNEVKQFVRAFGPDAILVTPLVDAGSPQTDYVRCARELGVPSLLPVHSWDNLTLKGGIHEVPDVVAVWNDAQREEAVCLHGVVAARVIVTGAVAYDHWFDWKPSSSRAEFCESVGLDPKRPFLLYLGSSRFIASGESEFFREWNRRIRESSPELANVQVLARPHPLNPFAGKVPRGVRIATTRAMDPSDVASRSAYFDAIYHSAAVVGILTSGMVEAAIVDRPVHSVLVERYRDIQGTMAHFHHLLPENGGMLIVADGYEEHVDQLRRSLFGKPSALNRPFVASFVGRSDSSASASSRLADAVEGLAGTETTIERSFARRASAAVVARVGWVLFRLFILVRGRDGVRRATNSDRRPAVIFLRDP